MAGKKGRSGRLPLTEEIRRYNIRKKAWDRYGEALDSKELSVQEKAELAKAVVVADMKQVVEHQGSQIRPIIIQTYADR